jgi:DNA-binding beta-propeller fold protein YncE
METKVHGHRKLFLLVISVLVAAMILACDLGGLVGGGQAVPNVVITAPPSNSELRLGEVIPIHSTATDAAGVIRVELWVDDSLYTSEISPVAQGQSPFSTVLNWMPQALGSHRIVVRAYNAAGNVAESAPITLIVVGAPPAAQATPPGPVPPEPGPPPTEPPAQPTRPPAQPTPTTPPPPPTPTSPPTPTPITGPCLPSVVTTIQLAGHPKGVAAQGNRVYVGLHDVPRVAVINADNNTKLTPPLDTHATTGPGYANAVAYHNGRVYVANRDECSVSSINASNPSDWKVIPAVAGGLPFGLAAAGQYVYVANFGNDTVGRIDPSTGTYLGSLVLPAGSKPALLAPLGQDVFVPSNGPGAIYRIPPTGSPITVGPDRTGFFAAAANANRRIFVTNRDGGDVTKIDANTNLTQGGPVHLPHRPYGIAVNTSKNRVYVVAAEANLLYVLDGASLQIVGTVPVGAQGRAQGGQGIAVLGSKIYVSNYQDSSVTILDDSACP